MIRRYCLVLVVLLFSLPTLAVVREVRVGVYENPPKLRSGADGQPDGILGTLLVEIARLEGWRLQTVPCSWDACLEALQAGKIDLLPDVAKTEERLARFDFHTTPALHSWSALYVRATDQIHSMLELKAKRIAVLEDSVQQSYLQQLFDGFGIPVSLLPVASFDEGFALVAQGKADAAAVNHSYGEFNAGRHQLKSSSIMFLPSQLFFATTQGSNSDLLAAIDGHLQVWQATEGSLYYRVMRQWMAQPATVWPAWLGWAAMVTLTIILLVLLLNALLRRQVRLQTIRLQQDLVQLREAEEALRRQHGLFQSLIGTIPDLIWLKDQNGVYLACNPRFESFFGAPEQAIVGKTDFDFVDAQQAESFQIHDRAAMAAGKPTLNEEWLTFRADGYHGLFETTKTPMIGHQGELIGVLGIAHDITERKRIEQQIEHLAYRDPLTELPNRALFLDRLSQALAAGRRAQRYGAVIFVDLDQFKRINDVHGHSRGDLVLREVSQRLRQLLRQEDTVARFGGDEFVILLPELSTEQEAAATLALSVSDKVRARLEQSMQVDGQNYLTTASIGITLFPKEGESIDDLLREADIAMYRAKEGGRNALMFFEQDMQTHIAERYALERDLREAIKQDALELFLQSQVDRAGQVVGAEALLRWRHPQRGLLSPALFIPLAEESNLIVIIGEWVLRQACQLLARLAAAQRPLRMAVNVSPRQFRQPEFVTRVADILRETGADARQLTLEITEGLLLEQTTELVPRMLELSQLGIRFSIDDFGTGYSSLAYLKRLPLNELKIDKSFVQDVPTDPNDVALVEAMLAMAQHLYYEVVAEGVENSQQRDLLGQLGCSYYQGYLFHRPEPALDWLRRIQVSP